MSVTSGPTGSKYQERLLGYMLEDGTKVTRSTSASYAQVNYVAQEKRLRHDASAIS